MTESSDSEYLIASERASTRRGEEAMESVGKLIEFVVWEEEVVATSGTHTRWGWRRRREGRPGKVYTVILAKWESWNLRIRYKGEGDGKRWAEGSKWGDMGEERSLGWTGDVKDELVAGEIVGWRTGWRRRRAEEKLVNGKCFLMLSDWVLGRRGGSSGSVQEEVKLRESLYININVSIDIHHPTAKILLKRTEKQWKKTKK